MSRSGWSTRRSWACVLSLHSFLEKIGQKETAHRREDVNGNTLAAPVYNSTVGTITCIPYTGAACCSHRHSPAVIKAECKSGCCVIPCENCPFLAARLLPYYKSAQRPHPSSAPLRPWDRVLRRIVHLRHVLLDIERVCIHTAGRRFASLNKNCALVCAVMSELPHIGAPLSASLSKLLRGIVIADSKDGDIL